MDSFTVLILRNWRDKSDYPTPLSVQLMYPICVTISTIPIRRSVAMLMLSQKDRDFQPHVVSLEALIPTDNFYRKVEAKLDLSFVRDLVRHLYKPFGRPSIDPVVFFKLQLIMFFEGIRSERQLVDMVNMRLDHRWFIGYDLNEKVPDHSALSKIRDRFGLEGI